MPYKHRDPVRHKFDKAKHKVINWPQYDKALCERGNLTVWISLEAIEAWCPQLTVRKRGGQPKYSDLAIEIALTMRTVYCRALRNAEGFLKSLFRIMDVDLPVPDHTTVSRRSRILKLKPSKPTGKGPHTLLIDSTGLKIHGSGEWQETKHGLQKRRQWMKLHLGNDADNWDIVACELTTLYEDDPSQVPGLLNQIDGEIEQFIADGAYDKQSVYDAISEHQQARIPCVIPPRKDAVLSDDFEHKPTPRDKHILGIRELGRLGWQKETGYNRRSLVETTMYRFKTIIGGALRSRTFESQRTEAIIGVKALNTMTKLGMPISVRV